MIHHSANNSMDTIANQPTEHQGAAGSFPPPGMVLIHKGHVKRGDWFFIESWGAWTPVPDSAIGQRIAGARIARKPEASDGCAEMQDALDFEEREFIRTQT